jgi:hypothetical protein
METAGGHEQGHNLRTEASFPAGTARDSPILTQRKEWRFWGGGYDYQVIPDWRRYQRFLRLGWYDRQVIPEWRRYQRFLRLGWYDRQVIPDSRRCRRHLR